jgi:hypothetical protein
MEIEQVVLAHFRYIERVAQFLEGSGPEPELTSPEACALGQWLKEHPNPKLVEPHARFHQALADAVAKKKAGAEGEARALLDRAYTLYSQIEHALFQ